MKLVYVMSDTKRFQLFKEMVGTTVYDEKKRETSDKMEDNHSNIEKINDHLEFEFIRKLKIVAISYRRWQKKFFNF